VRGPRAVRSVAETYHCVWGGIIVRRSWPSYCWRWLDHWVTVSRDQGLSQSTVDNRLVLPPSMMLLSILCSPDLKSEIKPTQVLFNYYATSSVIHLCCWPLPPRPCPSPIFYPLASLWFIDLSAFSFAVSPISLLSNFPPPSHSLIPFLIPPHLFLSPLTDWSINWLTA